MTKLFDDLKEIGQLLNLGKIILCPTDTIWGLSCDAHNSASVDKIYKIKRRDRSKPLILLVSNLEMLNKYTSDLHPRVENLIDLYDKPLTVIHKASDLLPHHLLSDQGTIAIRLTSNDNLIELINFLGRPIVSTSANVQGAPTPSNFSMLSDEIIGAADYTFYAQRNKAATHSESTIIKYNNEGELFFIR